MKKTIFTITALLGLFMSAQAFSPKNKSMRYATPKMEQTFIQEFGEQTTVTWSQDNNDMIVATFIADNQPSHAYFDMEGNYVCATTDIQQDDLPLKLRMAVSKKFAQAKVNAVLLMSNAEEVAYFFHTTDEKGTKVWKANANGSIELFKKLR